MLKLNSFAVVNDARAKLSQVSNFLLKKALKFQFTISISLVVSG